MSRRLGAALLLAAWMTGSLCPRSAMASDMLVRVGEGQYFRFDISRKELRAVEQQGNSVEAFNSRHIPELSVDSSVPTIKLDAGCWMQRVPQWERLPEGFSFHLTAEKTVAGADTHIAIVRGTIVDVREHRFLRSPCPGTVISAIEEADDKLNIAVRVANGEFTNKDGKILGLKFSGEEAIIRLDLRENAVTTIYRTQKKLRALAYDRGTRQLVLVQEEIVTRWMNPANWLRTIAGHPKQNSIYELLVFDSQSRPGDSFQLSKGPSGMSVNLSDTR